MQMPLADFLGIGPEHLALLVPLFALMIPIIAILTRHQREMAAMYREQSTDVGQIESLRREIRELRELVHQQSISIDNLVPRSLTTPPPAPIASELESRINV